MFGTRWHSRRGSGVEPRAPGARRVRRVHGRPSDRPRVRRRTVLAALVPAVFASALVPVGPALASDHPTSSSVSVNDADANGAVSMNDVVTIVFSETIAAIVDGDTITLDDLSDDDTLVVECDPTANGVGAGNAGAACVLSTVTNTDDTLTITFNTAGTAAGGDATLTYAAAVIASSGIEDTGASPWNLAGSGDVTVDDISAAATSAASSAVVQVTYDATLDCGDVAAWAAGQFTYDGDGNPGGDTPATSLSCAGTVLSVTFPVFTVLDSSAVDRIRYTQSATASERVSATNDTASPAAIAIADGTGPAIAQVELSVDIDGDQVWDDVDDVLTITWLEPATHSAGNVGLTEAQVNAVLGTSVVYDTTTVTLAGSGSASWTLVISGNALSTGVALNAATNGGANGAVTDAAGNAQIAASNISLTGGRWVTCGTTVATVTVNSRCIVANGFQKSTDGGQTWTTTFNPTGGPADGDVDLDIFDTGLLQIQVVDDSRAGGTPDQYELVASGGQLAPTDLVRIELNLGEYDPVFLIGSGALSSYTATTPDPGDNTVEIVIGPSNASWFTSGDCVVGNCGDDTTQADVDYTGSILLALDSLSNYGLPADFIAASRGGWVMTDAQSFGAPSWDATAESFDVDVAAPHLMQSGGVNTGEFKAFIPDAMFGPSFFNVSPGDAVFSATAGGSSATASAQVVTGGVEIEVTGYGYSSPEIAIKASAPAPSGGGGGGGGGSTGTTTGTVASGGTLSSATDATSDKPTKASVTSPVAGSVSITPKQSTTTELSSGQTLLNVEVDITAPAATPEEPLVLDFELDSSVIEGVDLDRLVVYRNGEPVPACADGAAAAPDPCLATRAAQDDGDLVLTVRTSQASTWNFATVDTACPSDLLPAAAFADVVTGSTHAGSIDCAAWWGLVNGTSATSYSPANTVSRGQVASVLRSLLEAAGADLPASRNRFTDDDPVHGEAAEILAQAGVLHGTSATTFSPGGAVTRAQLASMLVNAYEYLGGRIDVTDEDPFSDDDASVHANSIAKAAAAGFVSGVTADRHDPDGDVTREQLATFLTNVLGKLVDDDLADPPL
ncbi:MAG: S-layer homology domain-containing protein [Nitriliruptorales bacterium]